MNEKKYGLHQIGQYPIWNLSSIKKDGCARHPVKTVTDLNFHFHMGMGVAITQTIPRIGNWLEQIRSGGSGFNESTSYLPIPEKEANEIIISRCLGDFSRQSVQIMDILEDIVVMRYPQYNFPFAWKTPDGEGDSINVIPSRGCRRSTRSEWVAFMKRQYGKDWQP